MKKQIAINGGTGMLGRKITDELILKGFDIILLSRDPSKYKEIFNNRISLIKFDSNTSSGELSEVFNNCYGVINLAGASIAGKRWSNKYKQELYDSRILPTKKISEAISNSEQKPAFFINASATGIYGNRGDEILTEDSALGNDFLANLCKEWEYEAMKSQNHTRTITIRIGVVLDKKGGALEKLILPFKFFAGGPLGNGKQFLPWIHIDDLIQSFIFIIQNQNIYGAVISSTPNPSRNSEFAKTIGEIMFRPSFLPAPGFGLKLILGEFAEFLLASQRTIPQKLIESGFQFKYPNAYIALNSILNANKQ